MKESKHTDVLNKRLAELVAKDWRVITLASLEETGAGLLGEDVKSIGQNGRREATSMQPNCFHNLSHCFPSTTPNGHDVCTSKEVELEERLENDDIKMSDCSKKRKEIERKRKLVGSVELGQVRKRRKDERLNCEANPGETFSQAEAEKVLLSIVGAGDSDNLLKVLSSLAQSFDFRSSSTSALWVKPH